MVEFIKIVNGKKIKKVSVDLDFYNEMNSTQLNNLLKDLINNK